MGKAKFPHPINCIEVYWLISRRLKNRHWGMEVFLKGESVEGGERWGCMALDTREKLNKKWANKVPLGRQGRVGRSSKEGGMIVVTPPAGWSIQKSHFFLFAWRFFMISVLGGNPSKTKHFTTYHFCLLSLSGKKLPRVAHSFYIVLLASSQNKRGEKCYIQTT